jgi:hypothetical protein
MYKCTVWEKCRDLNVKACGTGGYHKYIMIMACMSYVAAIPGLCTHGTCVEYLALLEL